MRLFNNIILRSPLKPGDEESTRFLPGACPERHEILPLLWKGQNDTERSAQNDGEPLLNDLNDGSPVKALPTTLEAKHRREKTKTLILTIP